MPDKVLYMRRLYLIMLFAASTPWCLAYADSTTPGFAGPQVLSSLASNSTIPQLLVSGSNVYLAWIDEGSGGFGAKFTHSSDGGSTFAKETSLGSIGGAPDNLRIAEFHGKIGVVWQSFSANKSSIAFSQSSDNGTTFSPPIQISDPSRDSAFPQLALYGDKVYVAWLEKTDNDVTNLVFEKSDDGGKTFGQPIAITSHAGNSGIPKIYATDGHVFLMWEDNSAKNFEIFLSTSSDSGDTFGKPVDVSNSPGDSGAPQVAVVGSNVYAAWMDNSAGHFDIMFAESTDGGVTFSTPVGVSRASQDAGYPQLAVSGNNVYITWTNTMSDKNYDIYFTMSQDGGKTFGQPLNVSNSPGASGWSQLAVQGNIYVSWVDNTPGKFDIYIAKSSDGGKTFDAPVDVGSSDHGAWFNQMAATPSAVYLAWAGAGNQTSMIMFTKSTTFVPEFGPLAALVLVLSLASIILMTRGMKIFPKC